MDERIGRSLFDPTIRLPAFVLRETALAHDIAVLAELLQVSRRLVRAPRQDDDGPGDLPAAGRCGRVGITVATPWQAEVAVHAGIERILIANEVVDDAGLAWIGDAAGPRRAGAARLRRSVAGVERMAARLQGRRHRLPVLVEVGVAGGRTGVRTDDEAEAVASAIDAAERAARSPASRCTKGSSAGRRSRRARRPFASWRPRTRRSSSGSASCSTARGSTRSS